MLDKKDKPLPYNVSIRGYGLPIPNTFMMGNISCPHMTIPYHFKWVWVCGMGNHTQRQVSVALGGGT